MTTESACRNAATRLSPPLAFTLVLALAVASGCVDSARVADSLRTAPELQRNGPAITRVVRERAWDGVGPERTYRSTQAARALGSDFARPTLRIEPDDGGAPLEPEDALAPVRVSLAVGNGPFVVWSPSDVAIELSPGDAPQLWSGRLRIAVKGDTLLVEGQAAGSEVRVREAGSSLGIELHGRRYAGELRFLAESGKIRALNVLPMEEYLRGVVPVEVSPSWSPEALKTLAVAARTYALFQMERYPSRAFDVTDGIDTQMYGGLSAADPRSDAAIRETAGQILVYDGAPILATYHASSGGHTEDAHRVWSKDVPYLRAQPDPAAEAGMAPWRASVSFREMERLLKGAGFRLTKISSMEVLNRTPSGRAATVRVRHARGFVDVAGDRLKAMLGGRRLHSTLFQIARSKTAFLFTGRGNGHGVGLSQLGAAALAREGVRYGEILSAYYPGTQLARLQ